MTEYTTNDGEWQARVDTLPSDSELGNCFERKDYRDP